MKCVILIFSAILSEIFLALRRIHRDSVINVHVNTHYYCHILIKFQFSVQISEKHSNVKFHENSSSGSRLVPCGQTDRQDRHDEANNEPKISSHLIECSLCL